MLPILRNWAGNIDYRPADFQAPTSVEQLQQIVASAAKARVLGTGHSFNQIADTSGVLISTRRLTAPVEIDSRAATATVAGSMRYGELAAQLQAAGWALHNLGSLPHISVAGACATGTHGSGNQNGNLGTAVRAIELVRGDGELVTLDTSDGRFPGAVVSLGALGVVTQMSLAIEPSFDVRQDVYLDIPLDSAVEHANEIFAAAYSVSLFSSFARPDVMDSVWLKTRVDAGARELPADGWFGASRAVTPQHPIPGMDATAATAQLAEVGRWHERLPHFRMEFTPSSGDELQSEFFLPRDAAGQALQALRRVADRFAGALHVFEMRTVAADRFWLSPCYDRNAVTVHFTWRSDLAFVEPAVRTVQAALAEFAPRPHWGKLFFDLRDDDFSAMYPQLTDFRRLAADYDPERCFTNGFLEMFVLG